jgi:hypothetical protein
MPESYRLFKPAPILVTPTESPQTITWEKPASDRLLGSFADARKPRHF